MGYKNMIFDVMVLNMERQLVELAHERFGKSLADVCRTHGNIVSRLQRSARLVQELLELF